MFTLRLCIVYSCSIATFAMAQGPDPWDRMTVSFKSDDKTENTVIADMPVCISDTFYKRVIQLLLMKGTFETNQNHIYGYIQFKFTDEEYELLEKFSQLSVTLTGSEFRRIDAILNDNLIEPTFIEKLTTKLSNLIYKFIENNFKYIVTLIMIMIGGYYIFYVANWNQYISNARSLLTMKSFLIILFIISYCWECKIAHEEAEIKDYKRITTPQSWFSSSWGEDNNINIQMSYVYEALHPANIISKMCSKFITAPVLETLHILEKYATTVSNKFYFPISSISYFVIAIFLPMLVIGFIVMLFFAILFGKSFSMGFLGLSMKTNFTGGGGSSSSSHHNNTPSAALPQINIFCQNASIPNQIGNQPQITLKEWKNATRDEKKSNIFKKHIRHNIRHKIKSKTPDSNKH